MSDPAHVARRVGASAWLRLHRVTLIAVALSFVAVLILSATTALTVTGVSQYDEIAHFDYAAQIAQSHQVPPVGSSYGQLMATELSCRGGTSGGGVAPNPDPAMCRKPLHPWQIAPGGINPALSYSPVYYAVVATGAVSIEALTGLSLFDSARLTMALVFSAGAALLTWALLRLRIPALTATGLAVLLCILPGPIWQGSTVNSDAFAIMFGALAIVVATTDWSMRRRLVVMTLLGAVGVQIKLSFLPAMGVGLLLVALWPAVGTSWQRSHWRPREIGRVAGALAVGSLVIVGLSLAVTRWRTSTLIAGGSADGGMSASLKSGQDLYGEILHGLSFLANTVNFFNLGASVTLGIIAAVVSACLCGAPLVLAFADRPLSDPARLMAVLGSLALLSTAVVLPAAFKVMYDAAGFQPRYLLPATPLLLAAIGLGLRRTRWTQVLVCGVAVWVWVMSLSQTLAMS